jgi:hypothetical protein
MNFEGFATLLSAWNEPDADKRAAIVAQTVAPDFRYDDVHRSSATTSVEEFLSFLTFFRSRVTGVEVSLDGTPEVLRGTARFRFVITRAGDIFSRGTYFATQNAEQKIQTMVGFIDQAPKL